jgi:hypothetical protein
MSTVLITAFLHAGLPSDPVQEVPKRSRPCTSVIGIDHRHAPLPEAPHAGHKEVQTDT